MRIATVPTIGRIKVPLRDQPLTVNTLSSEFIETHALNDVVSALQHVNGLNFTNFCRWLLMLHRWARGRTATRVEFLKPPRYNRSRLGCPRRA